MNPVLKVVRDRRLRALGVQPLRLRAQAVATNDEGSSAAENRLANSGPVSAIRRLALQPDPAELNDPAIRSMYAALSAAVGKAGLQSVRVCDVAEDPTAAVLVFGAAPAPAGVPAARLLHTDALSVLNADRERKRLLWERMQALGAGEGQ